MRLGCLLLALICGSVWAQEQAAHTFGTTVVDSSGLRGQIYHLKRGTDKLPNLGRMRPVGSIYTTTLNVWPQEFTEGFPNVTERFEWFAIEYTAKVWIEVEGRYRFSLLSDDGSKLKLNDKLVLDNDGTHGSSATSTGVNLTRGVHELKVEYYQGPGETVALVLAVARPGEAWRIFSTDDFKPPRDPEEWQKGKISDIERQTVR